MVKDTIIIVKNSKNILLNNVKLQVKLFKKLAKEIITNNVEITIKD